MKQYPILICALVSLSACQLTENTTLTEQHNSIPAPPPVFCAKSHSEQTDPASCNLSPWLNFWLKVSRLNWAERQQQLQQLSGDNISRLKAILLSQVADTPYQNKLRAYYWAEQLHPQAASPMADFIQLLASPSLHSLELESAVSSLSKLNAQQAETLKQNEALLKQQAQQIQQQQEKIEQLLQIEKQLIPENTTNDNT